MATKCCRNLIIDDILNIVPISDRCPAIIQTVADINDAVDGTVNGQLTVERYVEPTGQHIHLYRWGGGIWEEAIDISFEASAPFQSYKVTILNGQWEVSFDQGATWVTSDGALPDPVASVETWFRNLENNCIYSNLPEIPLQDYCTDWVAITIAEPFFFSLFGTVNGVTPPEQATILATMGEPYQGVQGAFGGVYYIGGDILYLQVSRPSDKPVTASLATVLDENGLPLDATPSDTTCDLACYTATGVAIDPPSTYGIDAITINGIAITLNTAVYVTDANVNSDLLAAIQEFGFYDPTMSVNVYTSGQNMIVTIQSVLNFTGQINFNADNPANSVIDNMTTCI